MPKVHETATLHLTLRGVDLANAAKGWFGGASSPSFKVCAFSPMGTSELWQTVVTSARVDQELNPLWPAIKMSCQDLCGCDLDRPIQVAVFDQDPKTGKNLDPMGAFETTVNALLKKKIEDLDNVDVSKLYTLQEGGKQVGMVAVMSAWVEEPPVEKLKPAVGDVSLAQKFANLANETAASATTSTRKDSESPEKVVPPSPAVTPERSESRDKGRDEDKGRDKELVRDREKDRARDRRRGKHDDDNKSARSKDSGASSSGSSLREEAPKKSKPNRDRSSSSITLNEDSVLHLTLEGVGMANVEGWLGCSDPFFQVDALMKGFDGTPLWQIIHRSEHLDDNLNPKWEPVKISLDLLCQLDLDKPIRISIYDWEKSGKHNPMGHFETSVDGLLKAKASKRGDTSNTFTPVADGQDFGKIVVVNAYTDTPSSKSKRSQTTPVPVKADESSILRLTLEGVDMANVEGWFGCSDPFFQVETPMKGPDGSVIWQGVHRSEHIEDTLNPRWKPAEIGIDLLCQLDLDRPIRFSIFDWEKSGKHNPMGHFETSVNRLLRSKAEKHGDAWELAKAFITMADDGEEFGKIVVVDVSMDSPDSSENRSRGKGENKGKSTSTPATPTKVDKYSALVMTLEGVGMAKVEGWFGCSDPFFSVETPVHLPDGTASWSTFFESEHKVDNLNPRWDPAILGLDSLCQCDLDKTIRISIHDWEENGEHNAMGYFDTSVNRLLRSKAEKLGDAWDTSKAFITKSAEGEEFGKIVVVDVSIDPKGAKKAKAAASEKRDMSKAFTADLNGIEPGKLVVASATIEASDNNQRPSPDFRGSERSGVIGSTEADRSQHSSRSGSYSGGSVRSGDSRISGSRSGSRYSGEGSFSKGSYDSRRSGSARSLRSGDSFRSNRSGGSNYSDQHSKALDRIDHSDVDDSVVLSNDELSGGRHSDESLGSGSSPHSAGSVLSDNGSDLFDHSIRSGRSSDSQQSNSKRSYSPGNSQGSNSKRSLSPDNSQLANSKRSDSPGNSPGNSPGISQGSNSKRSYSPGNSQRSRSQGGSDSPGNSQASNSKIAFSPGSTEGSDSRRSRSYSPGNSQGSNSKSSRSRKSHSPGHSQGSRSYSPGNSQQSRSQRSRSQRSQSYSPSNSQRSRGQRSRSSSPSGSRRSYSPGNSQGSYRSQSKHSRSDRSNPSYDSRRSDRSSRSGYSRGSNRSYRSGDIQRSNRSGLSRRSRSSEYSGSSRRSSRSYDSRSLSRSGSRSYSSRSRRSSWSGSRSYSRRSYSSRSNSRRSYSSRSRSRSRSPRSHGSRSGGSYSRGSSGGDDGVLKSSAWEALQSQATENQEEMADLKFYLTLRGLKLANIKGWFGKTAPFFQLSAHSVGTSQIWQPVYTSESIEGELSPQWKPASMSLDLLCAGDLDKRICVSILDQNEKTGKPTPMGSFETSVNKLIAAKVGGFGSGDDFDEARTTRLLVDGKEMGRIVVLSAHADTPKPRAAVIPNAPAPKESRGRRHSDASYDSYSRRSRSRSRRSRSSRRSSRHSRSSRGSSRRSYGSESDDSGGSRRSRYSRSDRSESNSGSGLSDSEAVYSDQVEEDPSGLSEDAALHLTIYGVSLANVEGFLGTSDPFVQVAANMGMPGALMWQPIFRSEHVENTLDPKFKPMELNLDLLCKRDLDQPIQFSIFGYEETGKHQPMGSFETTVNGLLEAKVFVSGDEEEVDTSKSFTVMYNGEVYGQIVVAGIRIENPENPARLEMPSSTPRDSAIVTSEKGKKKKRKGRQKKQHQVKFNTHGDELSIGTIESNADEQILGEPKNVFGDENEDDTKSRPWQGALPSNTGLDGFDDEIGNFAMGEDAENDDDSKAGSITNIAEILARVEEADDSDSDDSDDSDDDDDDDDDKDGSDNDDEDGSEHSKEDEDAAMLEMMSSMQQSLSILASAPSTADDVEVDLEKFDEMFDQVIVDSKVVAEFEKKFEERAKRGKKNGDENEDPDLLRDTPRLILFESEKESKKKRGRKKKKGGSKFSKEFIDAMRTVFGDSDASESEEEDGMTEERKEEEISKNLSVSFVNKRGSESSLFVGDLHNESKEEKTDENAEDSMGDDNDELGKSHKSQSVHSPPPKKKAARKRRIKPKVDPAEVFAEERRRQEGIKILSTSGLKQEMADMKKGLTRKMMERELANLRKATSNKFSPFDNKQKPGLFEDYNSNNKAYGGGGAPKLAKSKPSSNTGLMDHLAMNDDLKDDERKRFDDLATVAVGAGNQALATLANIPSLNALPAAAQQKANEVKKKAKGTLGAIGQTAQGLGGGAGEHTFFSTQNAWDDDESQANVGLTGNKPVDAGGKAGLAKGQSSRKFPTFSFGKKKGGAGVQLDDDDGGYLGSSDY